MKNNDRAKVIELKPYKESFDGGLKPSADSKHVKAAKVNSKKAVEPKAAPRHMDTTKDKLASMEQRLKKLEKLVLETLMEAAKK